MKYIMELSSLINIRNFLANSLEDLRVKFTQEQLNKANKQLVLFDDAIVKNILKLDINLTALANFNNEVVFSSTENVEKVWDKIVKLDSNNDKKSKAKKAKIGKTTSLDSNEVIKQS